MTPLRAVESCVVSNWRVELLAPLEKSLTIWLRAVKTLAPAEVKTEEPGRLVWIFWPVSVVVY
jgi:hypothetical protein